MKFQLLEKTPTHQAASQLEEIIVFLEDLLISSESGPVVEKLERSLSSIRKEQQRLKIALENDDIEAVLNIKIHLLKKVARAIRIYKSQFSYGLK